MAFLMKEGEKEGGREGRWEVGREERREEADTFFFLKQEKEGKGKAIWILYCFFNVQNERYLCL